MSMIGTVLYGVLAVCIVLFIVFAMEQVVRLVLPVLKASVSLF